MTQNIYDTAEFFAGYSQLERSVHGLNGAAEWPSIRALLPEMDGLKVVDLGCGFGWFCRWAREQGAARVTGMDVSEKMLARAREMTSDPDVSYVRSDLEQLSLSPDSFDLAYSSLALHYVRDVARLFRQVQQALRSCGRLVFSVEHPIFMAPNRPEWRVEAGGAGFWPLDSYMIEGERKTDWLAKGVIKQHRLIATYINSLIGAGFGIRRVVEWSPSEEQIVARPEWEEYRHRPMFLLVSADR